MIGNQKGLEVRKLHIKMITINQEIMEKLYMQQLLTSVNKASNKQWLATMEDVRSLAQEAIKRLDDFQRKENEYET